MFLGVVLCGRSNLVSTILLKLIHIDFYALVEAPIPTTDAPVVTTPAVTTQAPTMQQTTERVTTENVPTSQPDIVAPVIFGCPDDIIALAQYEDRSAAVFWVPPTAVDDSGVIAFTSNNYKPGDIFIRGTTEVYYDFADSAMNIASCRFTVTVTVGKILHMFLFQHLLAESVISCELYEEIQFYNFQ